MAELNIPDLCGGSAEIAGVQIKFDALIKSGLDGLGFGAPLPMSDKMGLMAPLMFPQTGSSSHPAGMTFPKLSVLLFVIILKG